MGCGYLPSENSQMSGKQTSDQYIKVEMRACDRSNHYLYILLPPSACAFASTYIKSSTHLSNSFDMQDEQFEGYIRSLVCVRERCK